MLLCVRSLVRQLYRYVCAVVSIVTANTMDRVLSWCVVDDAVNIMPHCLEEKKLIIFA